MSWFIMVGIVALVIFICILILKSDKDKEKPDLKEEDDELWWMRCIIKAASMVKKSSRKVGYGR